MQIQVLNCIKKNLMIKRRHSIHAYLFLALLSFLFSCKKNESEDTITPGNNNPPPVSEISIPPASFTQKALIEQFTGAWNGACPDGLYRMDQLMTSNPRITGVTIHMGDAMEIPVFNSFIATFNNNNLPQFPSAMVNRIPSLGNVMLTKTQWSSNATVDLGKTANCGLAIKSTVSGNSALVEIHAAFNKTLTGAHHLTVYLIENGVTGSGSQYDQVNTNNSNDPASPYYNKPSPIKGFTHNNVLRKLLSSDLGDIIDANTLVADGEFVKNFTIDITGKDISKLKIVAFVNKPGSSPTTHEILNVQWATLNSLKNWD